MSRDNIVANAPSDPAWQMSEDWNEFAAVAREFLAAKPERNTLPITVLDAVVTGRFRDQRPRFGWHFSGSLIDGAFLITPPHDLIVVAEARAAAALGTQLGAQRFVVPGVNAETETAEAFSATYLAEDERTARLRTHMALYRLDALTDPAMPATGSARRADETDFDQCIRFFDAMREELGEHVYDHGDLIRHRTEDGLIWLWELEGTSVSLASRAPDALGVSRIGPVYTPPRCRRRGFASAVTHACAKDALARGASSVVLFTDLANPTSNAIYQMIGFRPIGERVVLTFDSDDAPAP